MTSLDLEATRDFLTRDMPFRNMKKAAVRLSDRVAGLFLQCVVQRACKNAKGKTAEKEDIITALKDADFEEFVQAFIQGMKAKDEGEEKSSSGKKKSSSSSKRKS